MKKKLLIIISMFAMSFLIISILNEPTILIKNIDEKIEAKEEINIEISTTTKILETTKSIITTNIISSITTNESSTTKRKTVPTTKTTLSKSTTVVKTEPITEKVEKTLKEKNIDLINDIKNLYGYKISYGDEEFWHSGVASTKLTDEKKANEALTTIKNASALFPKNFFKIFQGYNGYRVILFEHIENAAGVTSYEFGDDNFVALDVNAGYLNRVFFHETFHVIDQYINYKTYDGVNPFDTWDSYNPISFTYGDSSNYKYTSYDFDEVNKANIAFVTPYAKTSAREDRAELFADLMFRGLQKEYMNKDYGINKKAKELSLILRDYFPGSNGARWERFIDRN